MVVTARIHEIMFHSAAVPLQTGRSGVATPVATGCYIYTGAKGCAQLGVSARGARRVAWCLQSVLRHMLRHTCHAREMGDFDIRFTALTPGLTPGLSYDCVGGGAVDKTRGGRPSRTRPVGPRAYTREDGHVQRLRSRDGYQRPTVHGCRPPCVCESTDAGITALPDTCAWVRLLAVRETRGEAAPLRRAEYDFHGTFSAARTSIGGSQRSMDLGFPSVVLPHGAVLILRPSS